MYNIQVNDNKLIMQQGKWSPDEIFLSQCLWWDYNENTNTITADLTTTYRKSIKEFMNMAFPTFMKNPAFEAERKEFSYQLKVSYARIKRAIIEEIRPLIPYWDLMYDHQKEAVIAMHWRRFNFLAFQQRVGKSLTMMSHTKARRCRKTAIVCMDVGKWNYWMDMTNPRWNTPVEAFSKFDFTILDSAKRKCMQAFQEKYIIVNYESLPKYINYVVDGSGILVDHIVLDEIQKAKNVNSRTHGVCQELISAAPDALLTAMTGTPVMNRFNDMFAYYKLAGHPLGNSRHMFDETFIRHGAGNKIIGSKNSDKLFSMSSNFMIRKRLDECSDIPAKSHIKMYYPMGDWRNQYLEAVQKAIDTKPGGARESSIHSINNIMAQAKVEGTFEFVKQLVEQDEKVLVFTTYSEPLNMIGKMLAESRIGFVRIDGESDGREKVDLAFKFNNDEKIKVAICNMKAAGHSINLASASYIVIINYPLSPMDLEQAIFRTETVDKKTKTTIYYSVCVGDDDEITVDMKLAELNESKVSDINNFVDRGKDIDDMLNSSEAIFKDILRQYGNRV